MGTYARLGAQHERLNYTETLLDKASTSTREADVSTKKLKSLNRSMFAVHVNNPFTAGRRNAEMEKRTLDNHRADRDMRESTRKAGFDSNARMEQGFKEIEKARGTDKWQRASGAEKSKYQFEDDSEDDAAEDRIDDAMERTAGHVSTLNSVARLMGKEIEDQNQLIDRLGDKVRRLLKETHERINTNRHIECPTRRRCQTQYGEVEAHSLKGRMSRVTGHQHSMCHAQRGFSGFRRWHLVWPGLGSAPITLDSWILTVNDEIDTMKTSRALFDLYLSLSR